MTTDRPTRIEVLRQTELSTTDKKVLGDVEKFGWSVMQVTPDRITPGWSYTIGLHETLRQPELIVVGLEQDLAHSVLNEAAKRLQNGLRLQDAHRERELLENVECEFKRVEQRWLRQVMGFAFWFNGNDEFPVFQAVYPDMENRFPWEERFDGSWRDRQPLLFPHSPTSAADEDFWAANDDASSLYSWKFNDPPHTRIYTTKRVMSGEDPITRVFHDAEDGAWQFHGPPESKKVLPSSASTTSSTRTPRSISSPTSNQDGAHGAMTHPLLGSGNLRSRTQTKNDRPPYALLHPRVSCCGRSVRQNQRRRFAPTLCAAHPRVPSPSFAHPPQFRVSVFPRIETRPHSC